MSCCGLKGDTNIKYLQDNGVRIWNEWADEKEISPGIRTSMAQLEQRRYRSNF